VKVRTHRARDGQKSFVGKLLSVSDTGIELDDETSRKQQTIGFDEMSGANYEYNFDK
jgi:ribosome maturation factor RimP